MKTHYFRRFGLIFSIPMILGLIILVHAGQKVAIGEIEMQNIMKKIIVILLLTISVSNVHAITFTVNGINYTTSLTAGTEVNVSSGIVYTGDIIIPSTVTYAGITYTVTIIGESAFLNCAGLTSVTLPNTIKSIGKAAFGICKGLTSVTIPSSVKFINEQAFMGCTALSSITIPASATSISKFAFSACTGLKEMTIMVVTPPVIELSTMQLVPTSLNLYVPVESVDLYKNAPIWKTFTIIKGKIFSALSDVNETTYPIKASAGKIHISNVSGKSVSVYDLVGNTIFKQIDTENELEIAVTRHGIYFVRVNNSIKKVLILTL